MERLSADIAIVVPKRDEATGLAKAHDHATGLIRKSPLAPRGVRGRFAMLRHETERCTRRATGHGVRPVA